MHTCLPPLAQYDSHSNTLHDLTPSNLFPQRLAQLDKELDIRLAVSSGARSPSNVIGAAILSDSKDRDEDVSTAANPARAPGRSKNPPASESNVKKAPRLPQSVATSLRLEDDRDHAQMESAARSNSRRGSLLDASLQSLQSPIQQANSAYPNLKSGPRHSIGGEETSSLNSVVVQHDVTVSKVEDEQFMAPFQVEYSNL